MKKLSIFVVSIILGCTVFLAGCASKGKVTSSVSSKHVTVEQTTTGVYITLKKANGEDINKIDLIDDAGSYAGVPLDKAGSYSFPWPFAEYNKTYTIVALISGVKSSSEETVTFRVENDVVPPVSYTEDYLSSKLSLNASGDERLIKFYTSADKLKSAFGKTKVKSAVMNFKVYAGSKRGSDSDLILAADWDIDLTDKNNFDSIVKGYDLMSHASRFNTTAQKLNDAFDSKGTYFAKATVSFVMDGKFPKGTELCTRPIYTNDTVYTALAKSKIPQTSTDEK